MSAIAAFIDRRCRHRNCASKDAYRMIGGCYNCRTAPILGLFTAGHEATGVTGDCPVCGCTRLHWDRLATENEIPADAEPAYHGGATEAEDYREEKWRDAQS